MSSDFFIHNNRPLDRVERLNKNGDKRQDQKPKQEKVVQKENKVKKIPSSDSEGNQIDFYT